MIRPRLLVGAMIALLWCVFLAAVPAAAGQPPFNEAELNKFAAEWPLFVRWAHQKGEAFEKIKDPSAMQAAALGQEVKNYLQNRGWQPERFFYVASHVAAGLMAAEAGPASTQAAVQLEAQRQVILNNPQLSEVQKKQILAQIDQAIAEAKKADQTAAAEIPAQEMSLIQTHRQRLLAIISTAPDQ